MLLSYNVLALRLMLLLQDGIAGPIHDLIGILSVRVIHLVISANTTQYRDIPSASRCSPLVVAVGPCVVSVLSVGVCPRTP